VVLIVVVSNVVVLTVHLLTAVVLGVEGSRGADINLIIRTNVETSVSNYTQNSNVVDIPASLELSMYRPRFSHANAAQGLTSQKILQIQEVVQVDGFSLSTAPHRGSRGLPHEPNVAVAGRCMTDRGVSRGYCVVSRTIE